MGTVINGTNGPDSLKTTGGGDTLNGLDGNDILTGQAGDDVVNAGDGNDYINVRGGGSDTVDGGAGLDRVSYFSTAGQLKVDLEAGTADDGNGSNAIDHLTSIEWVTGSAGFSDIITGRADTDEIFQGNAGNDTLDGGAGGSDTTSYYFAVGGVQVDLAAGTSNGADGNDVLSNFENVEGGRFNDMLMGDSGANILSGLDGDDQLLGAGGNDTLIGGAGNDRAIFSGNRGDYTITTLANGDVTVQDNRGGAPDGIDTVRGVKYLQFADITLAAVAQAQVVNDDTAGAQLSQASVMLRGTGGAGANGYVTVFRANDASGDGIYVRLFDEDGQPRSGDIAVNTTTTGDQRVPGVAALADGGFVVIWDTTPENYPYTNQALQEIKLQRFDADGNKVGAEVDVNTTTDFMQRFPSVIDTADGGYLVVWQSRHESGGTSTGIYAQKFDASGAKSGDELHINSTVNGNQQLPLVRHVGDDGGMVVVWQGTLSSGANGFAQQLLDAAGNKVGAEQIVYTAPAGAVINFTHEAQISNGYVLTWTMTLANGSGAVMAQVFNLDGSARGNAFTAAAGERYRGSDVIETYNGDVMLVWDVTHGNGGSEIVGRNFNAATGQASGAMFRVSDDVTSINASYPTLSAAGGGDIMVNWSSLVTPSTSGSGGVFQQLINGNGEREFGVFDTGATPAATTFTVQTVTGGAMPQVNSLGEYVLGAALNSGDTVSGQHLALNGTAAYGSRITIYAGDTALTTVSTDDSGNWSADIKQLDDGVYHLTAVVSDVFGHTSAPSAGFDLTIQSVATIDGTSGNDNAQYWYNNGASSGAQTLNGGDGNDTMDGGGGADTLNGGAGNDTYIWKYGVVINEDADGGIDTLLSDYGVTLPDNVENMTNTTTASNGMFGNALDNVLKGGAGSDFIAGDAGNDTLWGNAGNDNLLGGDGNDSELGGDGEDYFAGGLNDAGNDLMDGGAGNDYFNLSPGQDTIVGGAGDEDRLFASTPGATHGVNLNLATQVIVDNGFGEGGVISGIERVEGTVFADTVVGSGVDEDFHSHGGNDVFDGGAGFDAFIYDGAAAFTGSLGTGTGASADGTVSFTNVEALGGGSGNDSLTGSGKADVLGGFLGNDTLTGLGGNDTLYGVGGADTAVYRGNKTDYIITTNADFSVTVQDKRTSGATLDGTDTLYGVRTLKFADGSVDLKAVDHVVSSSAGGYQVYQSTAAHWYRDGGFIQVFRATDGSGDGLYARVFDEDGNPWGNDILINAGNTGGDQRAPVVTALQFGGYAVAYHSNPSVGAGVGDPGWDIKVQLLDNGGNLVGGAVTVSTTADVAQRLPSVAGLDFGGFAVAWQSAQAGEDGHWAVYARLFAANGQPYGPEIQVGSTSVYNQTGPTITAQNNNTAVITWNGVTQDGHYGLIEQRFDGAGNKVGDEQAVFATADNAATLSVSHSARTADGGHVLTWIYDADGAGAGLDVVMARNYNAAGEPVGEAFVVASAGQQNAAQVLGLSDGSYMVVWDVENADGSSAIMGRRYSGSDNSALGAEFKISNSATAGVKMFPTLAEFQDGQIVVSWGTQGAAELTGSGGIYQQIIDFNGVPLFYAGDSTGAKPAATTLTVQTVVGGTQPVLDPAYPASAYYLKDAPLGTGATVSNSHLVISGTAALGATVTIKDGTTVLGTVAVDDDGRWALDVPSLLSGSHAFTATVTNMFGVVSVASGTFNLTVNNAIEGTAGADDENYWIIRGANGTAQSLVGKDGNDTLNGGGGNDTLNGGAGDDTYIINNTGVTITEALNAGTDTVLTTVGLTLAANVENGVVKGATGVALTGNALNNLLVGSDGNDTLNGGAGADTLQGGKGDDTYLVDAAGDVIVEGGGEGSDTVQVALAAAGTYTVGSNVENAIANGTVAINLTGNDLANALTGNGAANILIGNGGNDTLNGGAGNDSMSGGDGNDVYVVDASGDVVTEAADGGSDTIQTTLATYTLTAANVEKLAYTGTGNFTGNGGSGNDAINGGNGADTLSGGAGNDTLGGGLGNDSLLGGDGDDLAYASGGADVVDGGAGQDTVALEGNLAAYTITRVTGTDTRFTSKISGESVLVRNVEQIMFNDQTKTIGELTANTASPGNDLITGSENNDSLDGLAGADTLRGLQGDDTYYIDNKDDVVDESVDGGTDAALVGFAAAGTYTLAANVENGVVTSGATVAVNLVGNDGNNALYGNAAANGLTGGAGDDTLVGGTGNDTMVGGTGNDLFVVTDSGDVVTELAGGGTDVVATNLATYVLAANVENLTYAGEAQTNATGNELNNSMLGGNGADTLAGGAGNDTLSGGLGNDNLQGGIGGDSLLGGGGADALDGGVGSDTLNGGAGNDTLEGGIITDKIGYSDSNVVSYDGATSGVSVNLAAGTAQDGFGGTDKLSNINIVVGSLHNDAIVGSSALVFEQFEGREGDDTIDGGAVTDTLNQENNNRVTYVRATGGVVVDLEQGTASGDGVGTDTLLNITQVRGSAFGDELLGSDSTLTEQFEGMAGDDTIDGRDGFDFVRYDGATSGVSVDLANGTASDGYGGTDTLLHIEGVRGSAFDDELIGGNPDNGVDLHDGKVEAFIGNGGNDYIDGGQGYDRVDYTSSTAAVTVDLGAGTAQDGLGGTDELHNIEGVRGSSFNDTLLGSDEGEFESFEGREGNDSIDGKGGTDRVDYQHAKAGVVVNLTTGTAADGYGGTDKLLNIEDVRGSTFNDGITGNADDNHLQGLSGNDTLAGGAGFDRLDAGTGVDVVDGGADEDVLVLQGDYNSYTITRPNATDVVLVNTLTGENITARNIEVFEFRDAPRSYEETIANTVSNFGDLLTASPGADRLDGKGGADTMVGQEGDDTYVVDVAGDLIVEQADGGNDTVEVAFAAAGTYTLGAEVENATVTAAGTIAANVVGNELDNTLLGNAAANKLTGMDGNDTLDGGAGADSMIGGNGDDQYVVDAATDVVTELAEGGDDLVISRLATYVLAANVENLGYEGSAGFNGSGNALGNAVSGGTGNDTLSGLAGDDTLFGLDGNDSLLGGDGNDQIDAGLGVNVVDGGAGLDTVSVSGAFDDYTRTRISATETRLVHGITGETVTIRNVETVVFDGDSRTLAEVNFNLPSVGDDVLQGTAGSDSLNGGLGKDTMNGLDGDDTYVVDVAGDVINEDADGGADTVEVAFTAAGSYTLGAEVETGKVTAGATIAVSLVGNAANNLLIGNAAANTLTGNAGNDSLDGGAGNDSLLGGEGNDTLDGGAGTDTLVGGEGSDRYYVDAATDVITELDSGGYDRVYAKSSSYVLSAFVEQLTFQGTGNFSGTGNALDNDLYGGDGNDTLSGGAGGDALFGGAGNDSLLGGDGDDELNVGTGTNDVVDGGLGDDTVSVEGDFDDFVRTRISATETKLVNASSGVTVTVRNVEVVRFGGYEHSIDEVNFNLPSVANDVLQGGDGADSIDGGLGSDTMSGGLGDDTYVVDVATDVVTELADQGTDLVQVAFKAAGTYVLSANVENAKVTSAVAANVTGNALDNVLTGNALANTLNGGDGNDSLVGGAGIDTLIGGAGNDTFVVDVAGDVVTEAVGGGTDLVQTALATYTLGANVEQLTYTGSGNFTGNGNALDNLIMGGIGNDTLTGGAGNDTLGGANFNPGNDSLSGGDGNDQLFVGIGSNDFADGGNGEDTLIASGSFSDFVRTRVSATDTKLVNSITGESFIIRNVEWVQFDEATKSLAQINDNLVSVGNDSLTGGSGADSLDGLAGADTLVGLEGDDIYVVDVAGDVIVEAADQGTDLVKVAFAAAGTYTLGANVENATVTGTAAINLSGNAQNNILTGNAVGNKLSGGAGNDSLIGGAGTDTMDGGEGNDVYVVDVAGDVVTEAAGAGTDRVETTAATLTLAANVENLTYTGGAAFSGTGNALANEIQGATGNDTLNGGIGNDTLSGGAGNDSLLGGDGDDSLSAGTGSADVIDGGAGSDTVNVAGNFLAYTRTRVSATDTKLVNNVTGEAITIRNVETVHFNDGDKSLAAVNDNLASGGNDNLTGTDGNDVMNGGAGADTMAGGLGDDTYVVEVAGDVVTELADEGGDTVNVAFTAAGTYTLGDNVENATVTGTVAINLAGNALDNILTGNAVGNKLSGGAGNDKLIGGAGVDTLDGGEGNDVYVVDVAGDVVSEAGGAGTDRVETTAASLTLAANVENLTYTGGAAFSGTGNALANEIQGATGNDTLNGGIGNDTLSGGAGNDSLLGGDGDDSLSAGTGGADVIDGGAGSDTVNVLGNFLAYTRTRVSATDTRLVNIATGESVTFRNVETVHFNDGDKSLAAVQDNVASPGNDTLTGTTGNDTLNGGAGVDSLAGGLGDDVYVVDVAADVVSELADEGTDTVNVAFTAAGSYTLAANVENGTVTGTVAIGIVGNELDNVLTGNAVANTLTGGLGNDTLVGGAGNDTMIGGAGDDLYVVDVATDVVTEGAGAGTDRVQTALAAYTLGANVENLAYTGVAAFTGTGNALANELRGGAGADKLLGGAGGDTLIGGAGNDTLTGGTDSDTFVLSGATGTDTIADLVSGADKISVSQAVLAIGDGDNLMEDGVVRAASGGFSADAELVIFTPNTGGTNAISAAALIGSATGNYTLGQQALFVVDNGSDSYVYLFRSSGTDAVVSGAELTQIAVLTGNAATALTDFQFVA
ncbi:Ca2+-binding RTX toxin-like protein [Duganella sp. SG902]|uniref:calcium-binding protein n=1 Tax=Duganella sp. SG902 TaxID=2587016 RepID=UPI0017E48EFA|nr:hypothetical protein [Duganella sp. SG902]NVM77439.1 Ca2+-binding RTX toxin-like protein [Duganella sp. SG902]